MELNKIDELRFELEAEAKSNIKAKEDIVMNVLFRYINSHFSNDSNSEDETSTSESSEKSELEAGRDANADKIKAKDDANIAEIEAQRDANVAKYEADLTEEKAKRDKLIT